MAVRAVLLDVDGTLVDSNDAHARAWVDAFAEHGIQVPFEKVRRAIGMGGDKLMPAVAGIRDDSPDGQRIATQRREIFLSKYLPHVKPLPGARELVAALKSRGCTVVTASSATDEELHKLLAIAGVDSLLDGTTSSDDADESKPDPDIIHAALARAKSGPHEAVMIGDTPYDLEAGRRAGVRVMAFRSGGWTDDDLRGADAIYDGPADLVAHLDESLLC